MSSDCNLYGVDKSGFQSHGVTTGQIEDTEEGSVGVGTEEEEEGGVIWSRLKLEQVGLVTGAYLWRRHRGSETVALWENLLQTKRGEVFEGEVMGHEEGGHDEAN